MESIRLWLADIKKHDLLVSVKALFATKDETAEDRIVQKNVFNLTLLGSG